MYKNKQGLYEKGITVDGKRYKFRGKTIAEVNRKIVEFQGQKKVGRTFAEVADEWLSSCENNVRSRTFDNYAFYVDKLKRYFGAKPIVSITAKDIQKFLASLEYTYTTKKVPLCCLKQIFRLSIIDGDIEVNVARDVTLGRDRDKHKKRALTNDEQRMVEEYRGEDYIFGLLLLYTGCRRSELFALSYADIDFEKNRITINKQIAYDKEHPYAKYELKSDNGERIIPLLEPLKNALPRKKMGIILCNKDGDYCTQGQQDYRWEKYQKNVGLPSDLSMHSFRHTFATMIYELGTDARIGARFLGDDIATMQGVYEELRQEHYEDYSEKLNELLAIKRNNKLLKVNNQ